MAPVIWGLDLKEMQWGKFKGKYMFNNIYHLRKTKMIVYQIAMIFCVVSESVGTAALSDYVDQRDGIKTRYGYHTSVRDIIGIFSFNIFVGIAVATIFGSGFFFDLFWPQREETPAVKKAWKICSVLMCVLTFADAIALTVIVATQRATIDGLTNAEAQQYFDLNGPPVPIYRKNAYCVASTVILWLGMLGTFASTYIMWKSLAHDKILGPFAAGYGPTDDPWNTNYRPDAVQAFAGTETTQNSEKPVVVHPPVAGQASDPSPDPNSAKLADTLPSSAGFPTGTHAYAADPERGAGAGAGANTNRNAIPPTHPTSPRNARVEPYPGT